MPEARHRRQAAKGKTAEMLRPLRINRFPYGNLRYPYRCLREKVSCFHICMDPRRVYMHPFWGGVSPLQPLRSIVFFFGAWIKAGNALIPPGTDHRERPAARLRRSPDAILLIPLWFPFGRPTLRGFHREGPNQRKRYPCPDTGGFSVSSQ